MTSKELNKAIRELGEREDLPTVQKLDTFSASHVENVTITSPDGAGTIESVLDMDPDTGKNIFYWGWFWRDVDFNREISLAWDEAGTTGFCENNKWNYPMVTLSKAMSEQLRKLCVEAVTNPSAQTIAAVNECMNLCKPDDWKEQAVRAREEVDELMREIREGK